MLVAWLYNRFLPTYIGANYNSQFTWAYKVGPELSFLLLVYNKTCFNKVSCCVFWPAYGSCVFSWKLVKIVFSAFSDASFSFCIFFLLFQLKKEEKRKQKVCFKRLLKAGQHPNPGPLSEDVPNFAFLGLFLLVLHIHTSFGVCAAPKSWLKYNTVSSCTQMRNFLMKGGLWCWFGSVLDWFLTCFCFRVGERKKGGEGLITDSTVLNTSIKHWRNWRKGWHLSKVLNRGVF